ncbi:MULTISPECIES: hypothetical protein [unclassified Rhizobium]|uniref:hypothetical protein n=1 Tax=unclassified Rhizobium TaxID=2613769 RepID=UPI00071457A5|nr:MULTISPECIES: hypothetical protein [unclassified Rhizobium]KQV35073.1 hypothetical protein ASC86_12695 [Rhizobium sp. Root1212]KRD24878.1 hypothetical protein ASE37_12690 [Rhizobium sp. Root268]
MGKGARKDRKICFSRLKTDFFKKEEDAKFAGNRFFLGEALPNAMAKPQRIISKSAWKREKPVNFADFLDVLICATQQNGRNMA